jgi:hypothetical protein
MPVDINRDGVVDDEDMDLLMAILYGITAFGAMGSLGLSLYRLNKHRKKHKAKTAAKSRG